MDKKKDQASKILFFVFTLSGSTALIYEFLWERKLELVFGSTALGITIVVSTFFMGLSIGSFAFGILSDKLSGKKLLIAYGCIELGICLFSLFSPGVFSTLNKWQLIYLFLPSSLIGGTFPIVVKYLSGAKTYARVSLIYALNTFGGVLGVILGTFFLIQNFGVDGGIRLTASINCLLGIIILMLSAKAKNFVDKNIKQEKKSALPVAKSGVFLLFIFFLTGFLSISLEVLWTKILTLIFGGSFYSFSIILITFLLGIGLGSLVCQFLDKKKAAFWFGVLQGMIAVWILVSLFFFNFFPDLFTFLFTKSPSLPLSLVISFVISGIVILPATFLFGVSFPLGIEIYRLTFPKTGEGVGRVYSVNTFGGIIGSFAAYFLLLPLFGIKNTVTLIALVFGLISISFLIKNHRKLVVSLTVIILLVAGGSFWIFDWNKNNLTSGRFMGYSYDPAVKLLYYQEGANTVVSVKKNIDGNVSLQVNGKIDASTIGDLDTELLLGHIPLLLSQNPQNILVVGFGSGITAGAVSRYPVKKLDIVEISQAVLDAAPFFKKSNYDVLSDKRVTVINDDARHYLAQTKQKYDVIISEPSNLWFSGNANLFSEDFYQQEKEKLSENGIVLQWLQGYKISRKNFKIAVRTLMKVFPNARLFADYYGKDIYLLASKKPLDPFKVNAQISSGILDDLKRIGITDPSQIFDLYISSGKIISQKVGNGQINSDDSSVLEINSPYDLYAPFDSKKETFLLSLLEKDKLESEDSFTVRKMLLSAQEKLDSGGVEVDNYYTEALKLRPQNTRIKEIYADYLVKKAEVYRVNNNFALAENILVKSIGLVPSYLNYANLGQVYLQEDKSDQAIPVLKKSISLVSQYSISHILLGTAYGLQKDWRNSEGELLKATAISPKNNITWNNLASTYWNQGKRDKAKESWLKSLAIDQNQPEIQAIIRANFK